MYPYVSTMSSINIKNPDQKGKIFGYPGSGVPLHNTNYFRHPVTMSYGLKDGRPSHIRDLTEDECIS